MTYDYGYVIESLVSILLLLTILYCVRLNRQLRLLKTDEQSLRVTIAELITATEIAERAVAGLKATMHEGESLLGPRLQRLENLSNEVEDQIAAGEELLARITRITSLGRAGGQVPEPAKPDAKALAAAAQHFVDRARARLGGVAA